MDALLASVSTESKVKMLGNMQIYFNYFNPNKPTTSTSKNAPTQIAYGVISCISVALLLVIIYMGLFGRRMRWTAQRWHVINSAVWGIFHLFIYASFADKAPWPDYIKNVDLKKTATQLEALARSVFPAGMIFVFIESVCLTLSPKLERNKVFNVIMFILIIPVTDILLVYLYYAHFMDTTWYYEPIYLFNIITYYIFLLLFFFFLIFCFVGSCMCFKMLKGNKKTSRTVGTFADMWLMVPYSLVPLIMYGPSFGMTMTNFVVAKLLTVIIQSGLLNNGAAASGGQAPDMNAAIDLMTDALIAMPWFILLFPLVQGILAFVCLKMWREQLLFSISCGRTYHGTRITPEEWTNNIPPAATAPPYPAEIKEP